MCNRARVMSYDIQFYVAFSNSWNDHASFYICILSQIQCVSFGTAFHESSSNKKTIKRNYLTDMSLVCLHKLNVQYFWKAQLHVLMPVFPLTMYEGSSGCSSGLVATILLHVVTKKQLQCVLKVNL